MTSFISKIERWIFLSVNFTPTRDVRLTSCQQCDVPVCLKCIVGPHNGHKVKDMPENFSDKKKKLVKETKEIESTIIPQYKKKNEETESKSSIVITEFAKMEK
jgi:hypothetical protein